MGDVSQHGQQMAVYIRRPASEPVLEWMPYPSVTDKEPSCTPCTLPNRVLYDILLFIREGKEGHMPAKNGP